MNSHRPVRVLVLGQGGREHALAWKLAQSPSVRQVFVAPGNFGTGLVATNVDIPATDAERLAAWAVRETIELTVVGPEAALAVGVVDAFRARGLPIFGPTRAAARLESSKGWAKAFMTRHGIPTADFQAFARSDEAQTYLRSLAATAYPLVVKVDGLAAGKGVTIAGNQHEALTAVDAAFAPSGGPRAVVIEQFLRGFEVSFLAISDGHGARPLACAHDYKHAHDGNSGPMTGGMGAYSPVGVEQSLTGVVMETIVDPVIRGMAAESTPYEGILYVGLMLTDGGPRVLEFNARFGDPETQVLLPRWDDDLYPILDATVTGRLADLPAFAWNERATCGVVIAAPGYPDAPMLGVPIEGLDALVPDTLVFHGGTQADASGLRALSCGGRVLTVVGRGDTRAAARRDAYLGIGGIRFEGGWCRRDIGEPIPAMADR